MAIDKNADFTPSIPDSDVVPTKLPYNQRGGFKFWAQKVIPLVYDDSLSYYEVLCKVVNYLNNVIQNVDNLNESVNSTNQSFETLKGYVNTTKDTLINTYNELQDYVNTYFDNLDVQEEINAKLDAMADSGELTNLLAPFIPDLVTQWLNNHVTPTSPVVDNTLSISGAAADAKVTGDNFTELKEDISDITEESANLGYVTTFDGTKTISNVTIARKNANTLTVYGTADGWGKFDVLRGNDNVTAGVPTLSANLSAGTYTLVCNTVFDVLVGTDYSSSVSWNNGVTKTFDTDVCVWLRVTSSSRNYGTVDNPSEFAFAIYVGETDTTEIAPAGLIAIDSVTRKNIENIDAEIDSADLDSVVNEEFDNAKLYNIVPPGIAWLENSIINFNSGVVQSHNDTCVSDYIEIDPTFSYLCNYINVRVIGDSNIRDGNVGLFMRTAIAFYDKDKGFVATTSNSTDASKAIPSTAKYVRLTLEKVDYIPYAIAFYGNYSTVQRVRYTPYRKQPKQPQFYGYTGFENLKMVMFGDSITHGDLGISGDGISYVDYANDFLRGNIINVGLGGSRLSQGDPTGVGLGSFASLCENIVSDDATAWDALDAYIAPDGSANHDWVVHVEKLKTMDWNTVQAIGILYGANDWANNVALGTEYNEDPLKYDGACAYGLKKLLTKYPHLQVIIFTPFYREITGKTADEGNSNGDTLFDYGKSLENNVRPVLHCPVVDSGNEVGMNRYNITLYAPDGTHPRANLGQYRLGRYFAESIKRYVQPF